MIKVLFCVVVGYLYLLSIYSTSYVTTSYNGAWEYVYYVRDNTLLQVLASLITVMVAVILHQCRGRHNQKNVAAVCSYKAAFGETRWGSARKNVVTLLRWGLPAALLFLLLAWIRATMIQPSADQNDVCFAAQSFVWGDYTQLKEGGYIYIYPNQIGLMLLEAAIFAIKGKIVTEVMALNAVSLVLILVLFQKITVLLWREHEFASYVTFLAAALWLPLSFYVVFVYGNLIGLMLSALGFWMILLYLKNYSLRYAVGAAFSLAAAVQIKNNYLIALLAVIVLLILETIRTRKWKPLLTAGLCVIMYFGAGFVLNTYVEYVSGTEINAGVPKEAWIAMGLQENTERADGWYNAYNIMTYIANGYDADATRKQSVESIQSSLKYMKKHPDYALRFWGTKTASQWNDPTFQCFWIYKNKLSMGYATDWASTVFSDNKGLVELLNLFQSLILCGVLLYMFCNWKTIRLPHLLLPIFFLGGFFFHLLWEAKSQYTFTYFAVLIPYAVLGFQSMAVEIVGDGSGSNHIHQKRRVICIVAIMVVLIGVGAIPTTFAKNTWQLEQNSGLYVTSQWE
jgi:hypothetical protein